MLARFNDVSKEERDRYAAGYGKNVLLDTIPRVAINGKTDVLTATPPEVIRKQVWDGEQKEPSVKKDLAEDPQKRVWKKDYLRDANGNIQRGADGKPITGLFLRFNVDGSLATEGTKTITTNTRLNEKGMQIRNENRPYVFQRQNTQNLNEEIELNTNPNNTPRVKSNLDIMFSKKDVRGEIPAREVNPVVQKTRDVLKNTAGTTRATAIGAGVALLEDVNKWVPFGADLYYGTSHKLLAKDRQINDEARWATKFPVPPRPERVQQIKRAMLSYKFENVEQARMFDAKMRQLEMLSNAFWNK